MFRSFRGTIYAKTPKGLLVYDAGESFRPAEKIVWNPSSRKVEPVYGAFCQELFDANYGYGSSEMKAYCENLEVDETVPEILNPDEFWRWTEQPLEWLKDRPVVLHPCVKAMGRAEYLRILGLRARTLKRMPRQIRGTIKQRRR
jgi:hypothetical protein